MKRTVIILLITLIVSSSSSINTLAQGIPDTVWTIRAHSSLITSVNFSHDGQYIVSGSDWLDPTVKIWQASSGSEVEMFAGNGQGVVSLEFSPDDEYLAVGHQLSVYTWFGRMNLWDLDQQQVQGPWIGGYVAFSPDGEYVASGGGGVEQHILLHRVSTGEEIFQIDAGRELNDLAYSPDGTIIATAGADRMIRFWSAADGTLIRLISGHTDQVNVLDFSPDGQLLASGAGGWLEPSEATIKIWRVADGELIRTLEGHGDWIDALDWSPDSEYIISAGRDGGFPDPGRKIKFWRASDGVLLRYYTDSAHDIAFAPDGQYYVFSHGTGELRLSRTPDWTEDVLAAITPQNPPITIPAEGGSFDFDISIGNNEELPVSCQVWIVTQLPNGNWSDPLLGPVEIDLLPAGSIQRERTQSVPGNAPAGTYTYEARAGVFPDNVWSSSSFAFEKTGSEGSGNLENAWSGDGDDVSLMKVTDSIPVDYVTVSAYPNPFNPITAVSYELRVASYVSLEIYDVSGRLVESPLHNEWRDAGVHEVSFDGSGLASGIYFYRLQHNGVFVSGKMVLTK
jgi:WD40 repeat protein